MSVCILHTVRIGTDIIVIIVYPKGCDKMELLKRILSQFELICIRASDL